MYNTLKKLRDKILTSLAASHLPLMSSPKIVSAIRHFLTASFLRYLIIGFSTFFLDLAVLNFCFSILGIDKQISNIISTSSALIFNFLMSNYWTFKAGHGQKREKLFKYLSLAFVNFWFNIGAFYLLTTFLLLGINVSKVIITGTIITWNFLLYKLWVFKK